MYKDAKISPDGKYRYSLVREWDKERPKVLFIGLNPSTADEKLDDPTIRRCINFAKRWGYGGILVGNLFAIRSTEPGLIRKDPDPVGPKNDASLLEMVKDAKLVVGAWGNHGAYLDRSAYVRRLIPDMKCLARNKTGEPTHPLYIPDDQELIDLN